MEEKHTIGEYLKILGDNKLLIGTNITQTIGKKYVCDLSFDNRTINSGGIFVCKGAGFKEEYLDAAITAGAVCYVSERAYREDFPYITVENIRHAMPIMAKLFFNDAQARLTTVGITGTKGKTTVAFLVKAIADSYMAEHGTPECAIISSLETYDGVSRKPSQLTTPEAIELQRRFSNALKSGITLAITEVSSQALKYERTAQIDFDVACFNNIGNDHISGIEHPDFEDYFNSKLKIFEDCKTACINSSCDKYERIYEAASKNRCAVIKYGFNENDNICCGNVEYGIERTCFTVRCENESFNCEMSLTGKYNLENALAAIAICKSIGIDSKNIKAGLAKAKLKGRGERFVSKDKHIICIVDYAHNEMSLKALTELARTQYPERNITLVFGCPGEKAKNRRQDMGRVAGETADYVIITEDDPANESLETICAEIAEYVKAGGKQYEIIYDRAEAIKRAIKEHSENSVILLAGKGCEKTQKRANRCDEYNSDEYYAKKYIEEYEESELTVK